eukprot:1160628-Pelagomonas_calceolata.AAC.8
MPLHACPQHLAPLCERLCAALHGSASKYLAAYGMGALLVNHAPQDMTTAKAASTHFRTCGSRPKGMPGSMTSPISSMRAGLHDKPRVRQHATIENCPALLAPRVNSHWYVTGPAGDNIHRTRLEFQRDGKDLRTEGGRPRA